MNKKSIIIKVLVSGIVSFVILNVVSFFYYKIPVHTSNANGATDYVWESNALYIRTDEGIGFGKTNNEGYMNERDYDGDIDILIVGSSHMEDQNIPLSKNVSSLLNKKVNKYETYNIGVSGHSFKVIINNLDNALKVYKPKYVILEASNLMLSDEYINKIINNEVDEIESNNNEIISFFEKIPFFRLGYSQCQKLINGNDFAIDEANIENVNFSINNELNDKLLKHIKSIADKYSTEVIIMYHPSVAINRNGKMIVSTKEVSNRFNEICKVNDIYFLDMTDSFIEEYEKNYTIPTGFINGAIATGHLNVNGHRMIANELYKLIKEIDK